MVKNHMKTIAAPKSWFVKRKSSTFITKPNAGAHSQEMGLALTTMLTKVIKIAKTAKEVKQVLTGKQVLVDGKERREPKLPVGLMDVISLPTLKESYRVLLDKKGRLTAIKISEAESKTKLSRIESKTKIAKGKMQLNLMDGRNLLVDKDEYNTGDVLQIELPSQKIITHVKFDKKKPVLLLGGKHSGSNGTIEEINENKIIFTNKKGERYETLRKYAFLLGNDKSLIQLE